MSSQPLTEEVALRIGLAVRALPGTDVRQLLKVLIEAVGRPLTKNKLAKLRLKRFLQAAGGELENGEDEVRKALSLLKGRGFQLESEPLPEIDSSIDVNLPDSIRIACSSDNGDRIDGHFGSCSRFLIYQVSASEARLIDIREVPDCDPEEDKNLKRAELISDCHVLGTKSIGGPAAAKVVRAGLHPIKLAKVETAGEFIQQLQDVLQKAPPPWLAKVMGEKPEQRIRFHQDEEPSILEETFGHEEASTQEETFSQKETAP